MLNSHLIQLGFLQYLLLHNDHDVHATIICTLREVVSNLGHAYLLSQFGVVWSLCNVIIGSFIAFQIFLTLDMVDVYSRMKAYKGLIVNQISWPLWQYYHNLLCVWRPNDLINKFQNNKKNGRVSSLINPIFTILSNLFVHGLKREHLKNELDKHTCYVILSCIIHIELLYLLRGNLSHYEFENFFSVHVLSAFMCCRMESRLVAFCNRTFCNEIHSIIRQ